MKWDPWKIEMHRGNTTPRIANTNIRLDRLVNASGNANSWRCEAASSSSRRKIGKGGEGGVGLVRGGN